ncbi:MAG: cold shock and DUF1294 domain-containing protein [Methylobacter sp.]|uniref:Cold shock and DUF1294 domain-containing protein n=1 Tax=Candidatus Methylobacter titanis TaxID=3053457 RepID=A0AA43Q2R5_9GAMM|nr:cold shock and DUF1294 domain-containing protein [Candidatus Methylobacter titanis]
MQLYEGVIKSWKGDKGFGFIQPNGGGKDVFIHIRDLAHSNYQPQQGDDVCYKVVIDKNGKIRACDAFIKGQEISQLYKRKCFKKNQKTKREYRSGMPSILFIAAIPFGFSAVPIKGQHNFIPFFVYLVMSLLTSIVYASDKAKAHKNDWRTSESTLHMLEFLGGWPGALITQHVIRHKNKKISFQITFWIIVIIHIAIWTDVVFFNSVDIEHVLSHLLT